LNQNFGGRDHPDRWHNRLQRRQGQLLRAPHWLLKKLRQALGARP
jgi:hypothetical protein